MGLCQDWHIPILLPRQTAALGLAYAVDGRIAAGRRWGTRGGQLVARGRRGVWRLWSRLSEAYLLAGRLEDADTRAAQAVDLARQYKQRGNQAGRCGSWARAGAPGAPRGRARCRPLPPGPRAGRGTGHASTPGALPQGSRHPVQARQWEQAQTELSDRHRTLPCHGHDILATPDRDHASSRGQEKRATTKGAMTAHVAGLSSNRARKPAWRKCSSVVNASDKLRSLITTKDTQSVSPQSLSARRRYNSKAVLKS